MPAIKGQGTTLEIEDQPKGSGAWLSVGHVTAVPPSGASSQEINVTHLGSTEQEFLIGLPDPGVIPVTGNYLGFGNDTGQDELWDRHKDQVSANFRVTYSDGTVLTFEAFVQQFDIGVPDVDGKVEMNTALRITGGRTLS